MAMIDVTVKGAGILGLSCAWELTRRGAKVRVIDPNGPASGASGGILGALAPHVPENWNPKKQFQLTSLLAAPAFWSAVEEASGQPTGYARTGRLQPIADEAALTLARSRAETARTLWGDAATWDIIPATAAPFEPPSPTGLLIHDTLTASIHPRRATLALAEALRRHGTEILPDAPEEGAILHATGAAGLDDLSRAFGKPIGKGVKGQAALLAHDARTAPQIFAEALHIVPHDDGTTAIGSTDERDYASPTEPDAQLDALIAKARRLVPALAAAPVLARWAALRPRARSRAPILGHWPGRPGHFIANGGFKIGFGMAPGVAATIADLILDGRDAIPQGFRLEDNL